MKSTHVALTAALLLARVAGANPLVDGDADQGKAKSATCAACHGADGNSGNPQWPSLAGQNAPYIVKQLKAFKEGSRANVLMTGQAMPLSEQDMRDLAAWFSTQTSAPKTVESAASVEKGEALYRGGDAENDVAACMACHGPTGRGNPAAAFPMLKGQHAVYIAAQLRAYASGERKSDGPTRVMRQIAERMREDEIVALASYIQGLK